MAQRPRATRCGTKPKNASTVLAAQYSTRWRKQGIAPARRDDRSLTPMLFKVDVLICLGIVGRSSQRKTLWLGQCHKITIAPRGGRPLTRRFALPFTQGSKSIPFDAELNRGDVHAITVDIKL
jgi:hypothetical protein